MKYGILTAALVLCLVPEVSAAVFAEDNRPEYQREYEAYLNDLQVIAETGVAPKNEGLEADLAKMDSDKRILLTAHSLSGIKTARNSAKILNSVEIIRIPEEFRQEYADVYKEENKTISAPSLSVEQNKKRLQHLAETPAQKVAGHVNPFQFLQETPLTEQGSQPRISVATRPDIEVYFNQLRNPYGGVVSAPSENSYQAKKSSQSNNVDVSSSLDALSLRNSMIVK